VVAAGMNNLFPTLFSKTLFIVSAQLFITWLTTHFVFLFFKRVDPKLEKTNPYTDKPSSENILDRWRKIQTHAIVGYFRARFSFQFSYSASDYSWCCYFGGLISHWAFLFRSFRLGHSSQAYSWNMCC